MLAGFAGLQSVENTLIPDLIASAGVDWLVEMAPLTSPSPALTIDRHRVLLDQSGWVWPFHALTAQLPFSDETLPAVLLRHVFQRSVDARVFDEVLRCIRPGGLLVTVSANPWHRAAWKELGGSALYLPAWPQLLLRHGQHDLDIQLAGHQSWRGLVPGLSPILIVVARKPPRANPVRRLQFAYPQAANSAAPATHCRAA